MILASDELLNLANSRNLTLTKHRFFGRQLKYKLPLKTSWMISNLQLNRYLNKIFSIFGWALLHLFWTRFLYHTSVDFFRKGLLSVSSFCPQVPAYSNFPFSLFYKITISSIAFKGGYIFNFWSSSNWCIMLKLH